MTKSIKVINKMNKRQNQNAYKNLEPTSAFIYAGLGSLLIGTMIFPEIAAAAVFDLDRGVNGFFNPINNVLNHHWGKAVMVISIGSSIMGEGDVRQRAIRAGVGGVTAGAVIMGLLALFTV